MCQDLTPLIRPCKIADRRINSIDSFTRPNQGTRGSGVLRIIDGQLNVKFYQIIKIKTIPADQDNRCQNDC